MRNTLSNDDTVALKSIYHNRILHIDHLANLNRFETTTIKLLRCSKMYYDAKYEMIINSQEAADLK